MEQKLTKPMLRLRTIKEVVQYFKERDPGTAITEHCIRSLITNQKISFVRNGSKFLVDLEKIENYFNGGIEDGVSKNDA